jgi:hypothetical protein
MDWLRNVSLWSLWFPSNMKMRTGWAKIIINPTLANVDSSNHTSDTFRKAGWLCMPWNHTKAVMLAQLIIESYSKWDARPKKKPTFVKKLPWELIMYRQQLLKSQSRKTYNKNSNILISYATVFNKVRSKVAAPPQLIHLGRTKALLKN